MQRRGNQLHFNPCFPEEWPFVEVRLQHGESVYQIKIYQDAEYRKDWHQMDNVKGNGSTIHLNDDGLLHQVEVHCAINGN
jgi:cellobiose phosphorylase